jgi:sec-independent protein translocase protein TatA
MGQLGFTEMLVIFIIALLVFGPKKLPELGKSLGKGIREFKKASDELKSSWEEQVRDVQAPLNDVKKDIHEMGKDVQSDFYKSVEPEHSQHPAPETQQAEATHSEPLPASQSTEPAVPKERA